MAVGQLGIDDEHHGAGPSALVRFLNETWGVAPGWFEGAPLALGSVEEKWDSSLQFEGAPLAVGPLECQPFLRFPFDPGRAPLTRKACNSEQVSRDGAKVAKWEERGEA